MSVRTWLDSLDEPKTKPVDRCTPDDDVPSVVVPFDPRTQVSADAKYIVRNLVIWFLVVPIVLALVVWALSR
jgi:hypothetical protein